MIDTADNWFPSLDKAISDGSVKAFGTRRLAEEAAIQFGWGRRVIRCERRFERVWIVGVLDFQPETVAGVIRDTLRIPMLDWKTGDDGIKYQPVVKFQLARKP